MKVIPFSPKDSEHPTHEGHQCVQGNLGNLDHILRVEAPLSLIPRSLRLSLDFGCLVISNCSPFNIIYDNVSM